jgi:uracil-DNA glycosylase family 4
VNETDENTARVRRGLAQRLESLHQAGVEQLGKVPQPVAGGNRRAVASGNQPPAPARAAAAMPPGRASVDTTGRGRSGAPAGSPSGAASATAAPAAGSLLRTAYPTDLPAAAANRQQLLDEVDQQVRACTLCKDLACTRSQTVFGVGTAQPRVVFFGEAPGADEDRQGEPFVGRAGQLLTKIIAACGWQRSDVYIMNVLKCRPPDNRNPLPDEVARCRGYFERQFEILRPEYIVCVGTVPAQALLETTETVGKLRGRFHKYRDSKVLVTYHPSYLLRNPSAKKYVWDDMQLLLKEMGLPIPSQSQAK